MKYPSQNLFSVVKHFSRTCRMSDSHSLCLWSRSTETIVDIIKGVRVNAQICENGTFSVCTRQARWVCVFVRERETVCQCKNIADTCEKLYFNTTSMSLSLERLPLCVFSHAFCFSSMTKWIFPLVRSFSFPFCGFWCGPIAHISSSLLIVIPFGLRISVSRLIFLITVIFDWTPILN